MEIAGRIAKLGWHVVIYFEAVDLPELWDFFTALPTTVVVDHMGRPDVTKPVDGPEFELFVKFMREHANVWSKVSCPERLSVQGPRALNGEQNAYRDVVPFARRIVETFPDRVLWGTDWPHPNLKDHMPDDGLLVDFIPHIAVTPELQRKLLVDNPMRLYWPEELEETTDVARQTLYGHSRHDHLRRRQSRQGYHLNQFCMSLMKAENRARFKADERAYLDEWPMTEEQKQAVLARDLNRCIALGGNIYFLAKIGATDGKSFQQMAGSMTGMSEEALSRHDGEGRPLRRRQPLHRGEEVMARITASVYTSHVPAIGAALDLGKTGEPYWEPVFEGYDFAKQWLKEQQARRRLPGLQRSRHRVQPGDHPDLRDRLRGRVHSRPTKAGARARCRR